jgi:hypothetical protein
MRALEPRARTYTRTCMAEKPVTGVRHYPRRGAVNKRQQGRTWARRIERDKDPYGGGSYKVSKRGLVILVARKMKRRTER